MIITVEVILALAAVGGIILAVRNLQQHQPPLAAGLAHGVIGAIGLVLLIVAMVKGTSGGAAITALVLLLISAIGGFVLLSLRTRGKSLPKPLMSIHGLAAIIGYLVLLIGVK